MAHKVSRRDFLKLGSLGLASAVLAGCEMPRRWVTLEPYVKPPEEQLAGVATWYASTCRQCPAGCGILVRTMNGRALKIEGNPEHPLNQGKLCARGQAGLQLLYNPDRLPGPVEQAGRGTRQFKSLSWNEAINTLYDRIRAAGSGIAVWGGSTISGHLYDILQRFTDAVGAGAPIVFDLYTAVSGHRVLSDASRELFGRDGLPTYDISHADVVFSFGADFLGTWLSAARYGVEFGAMRGQALGKRGYLVQLESSMSITGASADRWLPIRPGTEVLIAQAMLRIMADQSLGTAERVARARGLAGDVDVNNAAAVCGLSVQELTQLAHIFATAERPLAIPGNMLTGQDNAVQAVNVVQTLNLVSSTAGQTGGISISSGSPLPGLVKPVLATYADVQGLIQRMRSGDVKVLLMHGVNPAYELAEQTGLLEALRHVPFVASFSPIVDETAVQSDLVLPDRTYLEAWGYEVVSPSFGAPVVSSQQPVAPPVFDARSTGDVMLAVSQGIEPAAKALPWADEVAFIRETVAKLPTGAEGGSGADVLWARFLQHGGWWPATFSPPPLSTPTLTKPIQITPPRLAGSEQEYPYFLHIYLSDLLSDGRGASLPWLQGSPDPMTTVAWQTWVELHPTTAQKLGLQDGDVVSVISPYGQVETPVYTFPAIRPDTIAIPLGQGHTDCGRYARERGSNAMQLVGGDLNWAAVRVKIANTGKRVPVAMFESKTGVTHGFINQSFPGQ